MAKEFPGRLAEGPERPGFPCPPPQGAAKTGARRRVRRRAGTHTVRFGLPLQHDLVRRCQRV